MTQKLITTTIPEERIKAQLYASIERKRKILEKITEKVEVLKMELEIVKNEYNSRIGRLFLKDNNLDLEIIKYKNICRLMEQGMSFQEAAKELEDAFYEDLLRLQDLEEEIGQAEEMLAQQAEKKEDKDIRALWKKLIVKFHPDLVTDPEEKNRREMLMKKINNAYKEGDFEALKILESRTFDAETADSSVEKLERTLVEIENMILHLQKEFKNLKVSDWYGWKQRIEKAKKKQEDIFAELERSLLDDIVKKIDILKGLKVKAQNFADQPI